MLSLIALLNFISFFFFVSLFMIQPIVPIYLYHDLGASEQAVGVITALMAFTSVFLRVPCAVCIKGRKILAATVLGLGLNAFSLFGYGLSWSPLIFAVFRAVHGAAIALNYTLLLSLSSMIAQDDRLDEAVTGYTISLALGLWLGPAFGTVLRSFIGLREFMFAASTLAIISVLGGLVLLIDLRKTWPKTVSSERLSLRDLMKPVNINASLIFLSFIFAFGALSAYAPIKAKLELGLTDQVIMLLFTLYFFIVFVMRLLLLKARKLRSSIGALKLLALSLGIGGLGLIILGLGWNFPLFVLGLCLAGSAHGMVFPLTASLIAKETPPQLRVVGNSIYLTSSDLGNLLGPVFVSGMLGFTPLSISLAAASIPPLLGLLAAEKLRNLGVS